MFKTLNSSAGAEMPSMRASEPQPQSDMQPSVHGQARSHLEIRLDPSHAQVNLAVPQHAVTGPGSVFPVGRDITERQHIGRIIRTAADGEAVVFWERIRDEAADRERGAAVIRTDVGIDCEQSAAETGTQRLATAGRRTGNMQAGAENIALVLVMEPGTVHDEVIRQIEIR